MGNNLVGQTIQGRYYVVKQLGRGGVGITFLAQDQQCFDSQCVVKQLQPKLANAKTLEIARRLFNREAEIMNRLGHCDRIPRLLAYFEHENDFFLVQELIEGHDLSQEIISGEPWSEEKTAALVKDILEVLLIVQQHSVIHRDLKPSNLMRRDKDQKIILIDFGSVKQVSTQIIDAAGQIKQTVAVGTKSYMPIEQMMGRPGFYSDIYAVGVIAIFALTGVHPKKLTIDRNGELIWRNLLNSKISYQPRFLDLLDKMVRYRYQERYGSATAVLTDLEQLDAEQNNRRETVLVGRLDSETTTPNVDITQIHSGVDVESPAKINKETKIISGQSRTSNIEQLSSQNNRQSVEGVRKSPFKPFAAIATVVTLGIGGVASWLLFNQRISEPEVELSLYENIERGFRVNYPTAWSKQNRDDFFATGVVFFSPLEEDTDKFKERVSVLVENLSEDTSLDKYTEQSLLEIEKLSDPNVGEPQTISLGENEGKQVVYDSEENGKPVQRMQAWSVEDNNAYVITYTAESDTYDKYLPTVEKMIESFETTK